MKLFYDLHLHSCLSPCGDAEMTPNNLVNMAMLLGMDLIALTDHNSCKNCRAAVEVGKRAGLCVVPGMELCTSEEAHVVCLFPTVERAEQFGAFVEQRRMRVPNRPQIFGEQLVMNAEDEVIGQEGDLLITATQIGINDVLSAARRFEGTAYPAHIDKDSYSVLASLGDLPPEAGFCAAEVTAQGDVEALLARHPTLRGMLLPLDSDAHYLENMAEPRAWIDLPECSAPAVIAALDGRAAVPWGRG
jgi:hypothetical protein